MRLIQSELSLCQSRSIVNLKFIHIFLLRALFCYSYRKKVSVTEIRQPWQSSERRAELFKVENRRAIKPAMLLFRTGRLGPLCMDLVSNLSFNVCNARSGAILLTAASCTLIVGGWWNAAMASAQSSLDSSRVPQRHANTGPGKKQSQKYVMVGAGDIAGCSSLAGAEATAKLIEQIPGTVFAAGDLAYDRGSSEEFSKCYDTTWGRFKNRTRPVPGNHEYASQDGSPYFAYWGERAGTRQRWLLQL